MPKTDYHIPIMLDEIVKYFAPSEGKRFIDATLGGCGHSKQLIDKGAKVLGLDQDPQAIAYVKSRSDIRFENLIIEQSNFEHLDTVIAKHQFSPVDGILFDLGASSHQFDDQNRGFSFQSDAPLDMRMNPDLAVTAKDLINALGRKELYELFTKYGDEWLARPISEAIVRARQIAPINTTSQLATLITKVYGGRKTHLHPATKVFQALRIAVNDELNTLQNTLPITLKHLKTGGMLAIISFHEGEDRIVKHFIKALNPAEFSPLTKKPLTPTETEITKNPRSRSAKLRLVQKL